MDVSDYFIVFFVYRIEAETLTVFPYKPEMVKFNRNFLGAIISNSSDNYIVDYRTVGQYTGLTDKNGRPPGGRGGQSAL